MRNNTYVFSFHWFCILYILWLSRTVLIKACIAPSDRAALHTDFFISKGRNGDWRIENVERNGVESLPRG